MAGPTLKNDRAAEATGFRGVSQVILKARQGSPSFSPRAPEGKHAMAVGIMPMPAAVNRGECHVRVRKPMWPQQTWHGGEIVIHMADSFVQGRTWFLQDCGIEAGLSVAVELTAVFRSRG